MIFVGLEMMNTDNKSAKLTGMVIVKSRRELFLLMRIIKKLDVCIDAQRIVNL